MKKMCIIFLFLMPGLIMAKLPNFYITLGISNPMAPEEIKTNYMPGTHLGLMIGKSMFPSLEFIGDMSFHFCTFDKRSFSQNLDDETAFLVGDDATFFSAMLKAKLFMNSTNTSKRSSYFFGGPGLFISKTGDIHGLSEDDIFYSGKTETSAGATAGLGIEIQVESTRFIIELGAVMGFNEKETTVLIPLRLGLALIP